MDFNRQQNAGLAEQVKARGLAAAFLLYGLIATGLLAINVPPFQSPDELNHFLRAAQIAEGGFIGRRFSITENGSSRIIAGGLNDPALLRAAKPFQRIGSHPEARVTRTDWGANIHWSKDRSLVSFPNTVMYPPFFYLLSAAGVIGGRTANLSVVQTLIVSRLLSGIVAVAIGALAITIADGAAAWIFAILTLPMSLSLIASTSQDGLLIACSSLAGALMLRLQRRPAEHNRRVLASLIIALGLVGMARPPYGALALLPLGLRKINLRWRILAAAGILGFVAIWSLIVAATTWTNINPAGGEPLVELLLLRNNPLSLARAMLVTADQFWRNYLTQFIGVLGWLDTQLPRGYYRVAKIMLVIAAITSMFGMKRERISLSSALPIALGLLISVAAIFGIQYFSWTPPGHATIEGVQGRYFLPLALVGTGLLPALGDTRLARIHNLLLLLVVTFPVLSLAVVMHAIVLRYYLH
ncbi:MAG: DUF2142 domain-containing protein [Xanthobacteraceae bacterium]|jgi:uncharacterized membrane protein